VKYGWPGKKRTYHTGRKRCRYLKDMRAEFSTYNEVTEVEPRKMGKPKRKRNPRGYRDHRGRLIHV